MCVCYELFVKTRKLAAVAYCKDTETSGSGVFKAEFQSKSKVLVRAMKAFGEGVEV
jgi:hypothetical protein